MEERRLVVAVALSLLVLTVPLLFQTRVPKEDRPALATSTPTTNKTPVATPPPQTGARAEPAPTQEPLAGVTDDQERRVEVLTRRDTLAFTNRGARLLSWRLNEFKDRRGRPEELVGTTTPTLSALDVETGRPEVDAILRAALFKPSQETLRVRPGAEKLRFEFAGGEIASWKEMTFDPDGSQVDVSSSVRVAGAEVAKRLVWGPGLGNATPEERAVRGYQPPALVELSRSAVERVPAAKLLSERRRSTNPRWIGVENTYFAALFFRRSGEPFDAEAWGQATAVEGESAPITAATLGESTGPITLYVGPKDYFLLSKLGHGLKEVVPVGDWLGPIVVPLMALLGWVQRHVGNYGWSIVLLTVLINLVMAPFRHFSIVNGVKMGRMAPELKTIQERYRKIPLLDPRQQEKQKETAALYARHGMNMGSQMLVGCLPLLLTMPFLFAFYRVLQVSIELRGASFLWIPDLSQRDPLFITPILMGASMMIMQRMTPTTMDPAQQRMMMIMPIVLVVMFFAAPGGLNLYWLASNVCSIVQQGTTLQFVRGAGPSGKKGGRA
jgi:YidC/Oxa1 family membrane protein insertase